MLIFPSGTCKREDGDIGNRFYSCFVRFPGGVGCCKGINATKEAIEVGKDDSIKDSRLRPPCRANNSTNSTIASEESCEKNVTNLPSLLSDLETGSHCEVTVNDSSSFVSEIKFIVKLSSKLDLLQFIWGKSCHLERKNPGNSDPKTKRGKLVLNSNKSECNLGCFWGQVNPRPETLCKKKLKRNRTDKTAMVTYKGREIIFGERDFKFSEDRREIYVCLSTISPFARIAHHVLLPVFCIVSMLSLIVVLILHVLFKELQNLYGFCLVCFSVTLMITSALTLVDLFSDSRGSFFVVQVANHYFRLCEFSWEVVIMHHVYRHFTIDFVANRMNVISIKRQATFYALSSMGLPVPLVISGLILHFSSYNYSYYEYEIERVDKATLFLLHLPTIFLNLTGIILLSLCVSKIRQMGQNSSQRRCRDRFFIALRVSYMSLFISLSFRGVKHTERNKPKGNILIN